METMILPVTEMLVIGLLTETIVEVIKNLTPKRFSDRGLQFISLLVSVSLCLMLNVSVFINVPAAVIIVGSVICGMIASRGSNFVHSTIDAMASISENITSTNKQVTKKP